MGGEEREMIDVMLPVLISDQRTFLERHWQPLLANGDISII